MCLLPRLATTTTKQNQNKAYFSVKDRDVFFTNNNIILNKVIAQALHTHSPLYYERES